MTDAATLAQVQEIVRDELGEDDVVLTMATRAKDVLGWDSLAHIRIMIAIERQFEVRFTSTEVTEIPNVGALVEMITKRLR